MDETGGGSLPITDFRTKEHGQVIPYLEVELLVGPCPGDINGDGETGQPDLGILLGAWDECEGDPGFVPQADLDGSGCIDQPDLGILLADWGCGT